MFIYDKDTHNDKRETVRVRNLTWGTPSRKRKRSRRRSRRRFRMDSKGLLWESSSPLWHFELARVDPNEASIQRTSAGWPAPLTASAFNRL